MRIFPDTLYYQEGRLLELNKGLPAETINTKVNGEVNLIFYKRNLFPIFLVDKVEKKNRNIAICRIMKNFFTITAAGVTQCEFRINMQFKFKWNPSILNRVLPQVLFHNLTKLNMVKYPTHDELGFLESNYKLIMSSVFKSS